MENFRLKADSSETTFDSRDYQHPFVRASLQGPVKHLSVAGFARIRSSSKLAPRKLIALLFRVFARSCFRVSSARKILEGRSMSVSIASHASFFPPRKLALLRLNRPRIMPPSMTL